MGPAGRGLGNTWLKNRRHNRVIAKIVPRAKAAALHVRADVPRAVVAETVADVPAVETVAIEDRVPAAIAVGIVAASVVLTDRPRSNWTS
jgi:hypothetical protein